MSSNLKVKAKTQITQIFVIRRCKLNAIFFFFFFCNILPILIKKMRSNKKKGRRKAQQRIEKYVAL